MFASAEVVFGFLLIFMLLTFAALIGTVVLIVKGVFSVLSGVLRRLLGLPIQPVRRYPGYRVHPYNPHGERMGDQSRRHPEARPGHDDATTGPRVYCTNARCGHENRQNARFCARCGQPIGSRA